MTRYGIIGCGMMGQEHLRNIQLLGDTEVAAIYEPDPQMAAAARVLAPEAVFCDSVQALLQLEALDVLVIVSPNDLHVAQLEEIAATRPLPVLVEKPLFTDPTDLARLEQLGASYPSLLWVAMEYRYMPPIARFLQMAQAETGAISMLTIREHRFPFLAQDRKLEPVQRADGRNVRREMLPFLRPDAACARCGASARDGLGRSGGEPSRRTLRWRGPGHLGSWLCNRGFRQRGARDAGAVHVRRGRALSGRDRRGRAEGQDRGDGPRADPVLARASGRASGAAGGGEPARPEGPARSGDTG